jgi:hypothetical protein
MTTITARFLLAILIVLGLEVSLFISAALFPQVAFLLNSPDRRAQLDDPHLGFRLSPYYPEHDHRGYRNPRSSRNIDVLAIGDSYTYGFAAKSAGAWPRQLEGLTGLRVYNAGVGRYGPCEYEAVLDELISLEPKVIVVGLFVGNDLGDAYRAVYYERRCRHLAHTDPVINKQLAAEDERASLQELERRHGWEIPPGQVDNSTVARIKSVASSRSSLYGLLRATRYQIRSSFAAYHATPDEVYRRASELPLRFAYSDVHEIRTVFRNPPMFALAVNLEDPRIREGARITEAVLLRMKQKADSIGSRLIVLLIPDKATAYYPVLVQQDSTALPDSFYEYVTLERQVSSRLKLFLRQHGMEVLEVENALADKLIRGVRVFPESDDHHLSTSGYKIVAEVVARPLVAAVE